MAECAQVTSVVLTNIPVEQSGQASGTQSTARQIGSALGWFATLSLGERKPSGERKLRESVAG